MAEIVKDNPALARYELELDGATAVLEYQRAGGRIVLVHTEVPKSLGGRGVGSILAKAALDDARASGLKVVPRCEFVAGYIARHPEYQDLLAPA